MLNNAPKTIVHKGKKTFRDCVGGLGFIFALFAFGHFQSGNVGGMLIAAGLSCGLFYCASKIKTTMKATGQRTFYR